MIKNKIVIDMHELQKVNNKELELEVEQLVIKLKSILVDGKYTNGICYFE